MLCEVCGERSAREGYRDCGDRECWKARIASVSMDFAPTRSIEGGRRLGRGGARKFQSRLDRYAGVRAQGIQPRTTAQRDIEFAEAYSNHSQEAFRADAPALGFDPAALTEGAQAIKGGNDA